MPMRLRQLLFMALNCLIGGDAPVRLFSPPHFGPSSGLNLGLLCFDRLPRVRPTESMRSVFLDRLIVKAIPTQIKSQRLIQSESLDQAA